MANLLNVIDSSAAKEVKDVPEELENKWEMVTEKQDHGRWLKKQLPRHSNQLISEWADKVITEQDLAVEDLLWDTFVDTNNLPVPMRERASPTLNNLGTTPRAHLSDLLEVTKKLGFVVVPWEYLDKKSYADESYGMREAIEGFGKLDERMDVYVICPPTYYSLEKHIDSKDPNKQIFAGKNEQAFMALRLTLPVIRSMKTQIEVLKSNQNAIKQDQRNMRDAVRSLASGQDQLRSQMASLKTDVSAQLEQMQQALAAELRSSTTEAVREAKQILTLDIASDEDKSRAQSILDSLGDLNLADMNEALAALQEITFDLLEPLMFAVKKGTNLRDFNVGAYIGPCWGPDFEDIVAVAAELKVSKESRKSAEDMLVVWGNIYGNKVSKSTNASGYGRDNPYRHNDSWMRRY